MKQSMLLLSAMLITTSATIVESGQDTSAQSSVNENSRRVIQVKAQETGSIKPGDVLNLSDFTKMPSGIMYKVIKKGSGYKPVNGETLVVHYSGYLLVDGKKVGLKFDSSLDRNSPFSFKLGAHMVIPGWEISLADMKIGETRIVVLPSKQAYGSRATASIPADSTLIFEITLIKAS